MAVYTFGSGKMGQLGLGNFEDSLVPSLIEGLKGKKINKVRSGEQHSLALTEFGDVYVWGRGKEGQLGNGVRENRSTPQHVSALKHERIIDAECGYYHSVALSDTGRVYTWGKLHTQATDNTAKQYFGMAVEMVGMQSQSARKIVDASMNKYFSGTANLSKEERSELGNSFGNFVQINQLVPIEITSFITHTHKVIQVSAGYSYSVAVTECGEVYTWGFNEKGQLGLGHRFPVDEPKRVDSLWSNQIIIKRAACGQQHTAVLTDNGQVYTFGLGVFGQLGHGELKDELYPRCVEEFVQGGHTIVDISMGSYYSVARTINGQVFSWGHGEYGQHGGKENYADWNVGEFDSNSKDRHHYHSIPRPLIGFEARNIIAVSGGHLHSVAVTDDQSLYTWGWGASGCLGHGDRRFQLVPKIVSSLQGESIAAVCAGFKHTLIVKAGHQSTFALDYQGLLDNKAYSDLIFQVDGKMIHGHRSILCARCPYINKMVLMQQRFYMPEQLTTLKITGVKYNVFMALLRYLYTDHLKIASHLAKDLVTLAAKFEVPRLVAMCKRTVFSLRDEGLTIPDSTFTEDILNLVNNSSSFYDVVFNIQGSKVYGHKAILKSRCKYFERLFESDFKEKDQAEFQVDENISEETFVAVLQYIYGNDESVISPDNAVDLLQAADRFMMEDLRQTLEYFIEQGVDLENVPWLLEISDRFGAPKLKRVCTELVLSNKDNLNIIRNTSAFSDIRISSPHLVRELDFKASKVNLAKPGELMRPAMIQVQ